MYVVEEGAEVVEVRLSTNETVLKVVVVVS